MALGAAIAQSLPLLAPGSSEAPCLGDICDRNVLRRSRHYTPLFIPVVGPVWTLGYSDTRGEPIYTAVLAASLAHSTTFGTANRFTVERGVTKSLSSPRRSMNAKTPGLISTKS